jgi:hypothetical protein
LCLNKVNIGTFAPLSYALGVMLYSSDYQKHILVSIFEQKRLKPKKKP